MANQSSWEGSKDYGDIFKFYPPKMETHVAALEELFRGEEFGGKNILDVGCGLGQTVRELSKNSKAVGIDREYDQLRNAVKMRGGNRFAKADAACLPFRDGQFDYVLSLMVLMIFDDEKLDESLSETSRVLRPGGRFLFGIVNPHSELWDLETGLCYDDESRYQTTEKRTWVLNLTDGTRRYWDYFHRPWEKYQEMFSSNGLAIRNNKLIRPVSSLKEQYDGRYASREYLLSEAIKI